LREARPTSRPARPRSDTAGFAQIGSPGRRASMPTRDRGGLTLRRASTMVRPCVQNVDTAGSHKVPARCRSEVQCPNACEPRRRSRRGPLSRLDARAVPSPL
jgi:hypothetical protein